MSCLFGMGFTDHFTPHSNGLGDDSRDAMRLERIVQQHLEMFLYACANAMNLTEVDHTHWLRTMSSQNCGEKETRRVASAQLTFRARVRVHVPGGRTYKPLPLTTYRTLFIALGLARLL